MNRNFAIKLESSSVYWLPVVYLLLFIAVLFDPTTNQPLGINLWTSAPDQLLHIGHFLGKLLWVWGVVSGTIMLSAIIGLYNPEALQKSAVNIIEYRDLVSYPAAEKHQSVWRIITKVVLVVLMIGSGHPIIGTIYALSIIVFKIHTNQVYGAVNDILKPQRYITK